MTDTRLDIFNTSSGYAKLSNEIKEGIIRTLGIGSLHRVPPSNGVVVVLQNLMDNVGIAKRLDELRCFPYVKNIVAEVVPHLSTSEPFGTRVKLFANAVADYIESKSQFRFNRSKDKILDVFLFNKGLAPDSPEAQWLEAATVLLHAYLIIMGS